MGAVTGAYGEMDEQHTVCGHCCGAHWTTEFSLYCPISIISWNVLYIPHTPWWREYIAREVVILTSAIVSSQAKQYGVIPTQRYHNNTPSNSMHV